MTVSTWVQIDTPKYSFVLRGKTCFPSVSSDKTFALQLAVWGLRGVTRVILSNNPLSGALIMAALYWASPWQALLGALGVLASTLTAVIMGQDRWNDMNIFRDTHTHM